MHKMWMGIILIGLAVIMFGALYDLKQKIRRNAKEVDDVPRTTYIHPPKQESIFEWPATGYFDFDIVGESNYQRALASIASAANDDDLTALLIPEDTNQYDPKAVRVEINGAVVGYLARDEARAFRRRLSQKKLTGQKTKTKAILMGGHVKNGKQMSYGVMLDLKPFD